MSYQLQVWGVYCVVALQQLLPVVVKSCRQVRKCNPTKPWNGRFQLSIAPWILGDFLEGRESVRLKVIPLTTKTPPFFQKEVYCGLNRRVFSVFIFFLVGSILIYINMFEDI